MNWNHLFSMQEKLDRYISDNHNVDGRNLFEEKYLALLVELGELANETRCFKFWSTKDRSEKEIIIAEYVDGIHFLLSIGLEKGYIFNELKSEETLLSETEQFNIIFTNAAQFKQAPTLENYKKLFREYLALGVLLGYNSEDIQEAYIKKNEVNFARQDEGY